MKRLKPKKPVKLKMLEGNPGKRKLGKEPMPPKGNLMPPDYMTGYALEEWHRVIDGLKIMELVVEIDQTVVAAYCASYSIWRMAHDEFEKLKKKSVKKALILKTAQGNHIQQPLLGIMNKAAADMVKYANELGLSPASRTRLNVLPEKPKKSKFDGLIAKPK